VCASTKNMKADLFYELVQGFNPRERNQANLEKATTQSVVSGNSEAQMSDIFIDPAVVKSNENLSEMLTKVLSLSFHLMIALHEIEISEYYRPKQDEKSILSPVSIDPITLKSVHPDDIPSGCDLKDTRGKWIVSDLDLVYKELLETVLLLDIFGKEERLLHDVFLFKLAREHPEFLKTH